MFQKVERGSFFSKNKCFSDKEDGRASQEVDVQFRHSPSPRASRAEAAV
jgi:hypothetical protein